MWLLNPTDQSLRWTNFGIQLLLHCNELQCLESSSPNLAQVLKYLAQITWTTFVVILHPFWSLISSVFPSSFIVMHGKQLQRKSIKFLLLCSTEEKSHRFLKKCGWVKTDRIVIFEWTFLLKTHRLMHVDTAHNSLVFVPTPHSS